MSSPQPAGHLAELMVLENAHATPRPKECWSDLALLQVFPAEAHGKKLNELIRHSGILDMIRNRIAHTVMRDETKETISIEDGLLISGC